MTNELITMKVSDKKLKEILDKLTAARDTIHACYIELGALGYIEITDKEEAASGN